MAPIAALLRARSRFSSGSRMKNPAAKICLIAWPNTTVTSMVRSERVYPWAASAGGASVVVGGLVDAGLPSFIETPGHCR